MQARVARLESDIEYIKRDISEIKAELRGVRGDSSAEFRSIRSDMRSDFLITWSGLIIVALGLAGMMAKGFGWL